MTDLLNNEASKCTLFSTLLHVYSDCHSIDPVIHPLCLLSYLIPDQIKPSHEKPICFCPVCLLTFGLIMI